MAGIEVTGLAGLVVLAALAGGAPAAAGTQDKPGPAQQKKKKPASNAPAAYLPFAPGATWKWRFQQKPGGKPVEKTLRCVRRVRSGDHTCWELRSAQGRYRSWEYAAAPAGGYLVFHNRYLGGMRGVAKRKPTRLIPGPIGVETRWKWAELGSVQTSGGSSYPSADVLRMHFEGRIESMDAAVAVPAGEFRAVQVRITMTSEYFGDTERVLWLVRGKGVVKDVTTNVKSGRSNVLELLGFTPGSKTGAAPIAQIEDILGDRRFRRMGKPDVIEPLAGAELEPLVSSTFFIARWAKPIEQSILFRHDGEHTTIFNPVLAKSWRELVRREHEVVGQNEGTGVAKAYGILLAAYAGMTEIKARGTDVGVRGNSDFDVKAHIRGKDINGKPARRWARMWFEDNELVKLQSDIVKSETVRAPRRR